MFKDLFTVDVLIDKITAHMYGPLLRGMHIH